MNPIIHFDVTGPDDERLRSFYGEVLGWKIDPKGPGYALVTTPHLRGAIVEGETSSVTFGVGVPNLDAAITSALEHGATLVMPPTNNGWVIKAQILDPCGNAIVLIQS